MTFGIPGREAPAPGTPKRTAPTARISLSALENNLGAVLARSRSAIIDVRADGWGHGAAFVAVQALAAGADAVLVDDSAAQALAGVIDPARMVFEQDANTADAVYGLTDGFAPVLSLHGQVLSLKRLKRGEGVSYGYTHRADQDTTVALITGGYAQGIVRALGNTASVQIAGEQHPIVGRVAMDVCVVDVGGFRDLRRGDPVIFFGGQAPASPTLSAWGAATGMTAGELVTAIGLRNIREYTA